MSTPSASLTRLVFVTEPRKKFLNPLRFGDGEDYRFDARGLKSLHTDPARDVNRKKRSKVQGGAKIALPRLLNPLNSDEIEWDFEPELCFRGMVGVSV